MNIQKCWVWIQKDSSPAQAWLLSLKILFCNNQSKKLDHKDIYMVLSFAISHRTLLIEFDWLEHLSFIIPIIVS